MNTAVAGALPMPGTIPVLGIRRRWRGTKVMLDILVWSGLHRSLVNRLAASTCGNSQEWEATDGARTIRQQHNKREETLMQLVTINMKRSD